jgi:hypothetical protein
LSGRAQAFELTDYLFYSYAVAAFCSATVFSAPPEYGWDTWLTYWSIGATFLFILLRNYVVMRGIDRSDHNSDERYAFLRGVGFWGGAFERVLRLVIIFSVIVTPRGLFGFASLPLEQLSASLARSALSIKEIKSEAIRPGGSLIHSGLYYYAVVLFILFAMFFLWDIIITFSVRSRIRKGTIKTDIDFAQAQIPDETYRSTLRYYNICVPRKESRTDSSQVDFRSVEVFKATNRERLLLGKAFRLYFSSSKFAERLFGAMLSLFIIIAAASDFSTTSMIVLGVLMSIYFISVSRNEHYLPSVVSFLFIWITYFVEPLVLQRASKKIGASMAHVFSFRWMRKRNSGKVSA